jgi:DNA polymerase III epsilon subunit family exonuclease
VIELNATSIWRVPLAFIDFETTGLSSAGGDRVVEVAIVRIDHLDESEPMRFQQLINPGKPVPATAEAIHGIGDDMLADAPSFSAALPDIAKHLKGALLVAHNAPFDVGFLHAECSRAGLDVPPHGPVLDTLRLARALFGFPSCGLSSLAKRMNVPLTDHHRALADATATWTVCKKMIECIDPTHRLTVSDLNQRIANMAQGGPMRGEMKQMFRQAAKDQSTLEIDYTRVQGDGELKTTRRITVQAWRPPNLKAWCHLRNDERVFRLERIQQVRLLSEPR